MYVAYIDVACQNDPSVADIQENYFTRIKNLLCIALLGDRF